VLKDPQVPKVPKVLPHQLKVLKDPQVLKVQ
jgi:hypothetical protein